MKISKKGIELIKKFEGCKLTAYQDIVGVWTIGFGHTKGVKRGQTITQAQANAWLATEIETHMSTAEKLIKVTLNQNQYDALASFHYNLGQAILKDSTLLKLINAKKWTESANEMKAYCHAGGKVVQGLVNRRNAEAKLFLEKAATNATAEKSKYYTTNPQRVKLLKNSYLRKSNAIEAKDWNEDHNRINKLFKKGEEFVITSIKKTKGGTPRLVTQSGHLLTANKEFVAKVTTTSELYYTVKTGDTVSAIAASHKVSIGQIKKLNNLDNSFKIYAGNKLRVR